MITPADIAKKLTLIPSYYHDGVDESEIGDFIYNYLQQFSFLHVEQQIVEGKRFNIIARTKGTPQLLIAGHMDTVQPRQGWTKEQGALEDGRLYGLGANDTKGGVATVLSSIQHFKDINGLMLLFYCDEEYDFKGIKKFVELQSEPVGKLAIFTEPMQLQLRRAHRGIIEIKFAIWGKTGHAGNPAGGNSAIRSIMRIFEAIDKEVEKHTDDYLGSSSCNIAFIHGGLCIGKDGQNIILGQQGNSIPDYAEAIIDIRPTSSLNATIIRDVISRATAEYDVRLDHMTTRHDIKGLYTPQEELSRLEKVMTNVLGVCEYIDPKNKGAGDAGFVREKFSIPAAYLGPIGKGTHKPDEWVDIASLDTLQEIYIELIKEYCQTVH